MSPVPAPGQPSVSMDSIMTTPTTISLSWSVPSSSVVTSYEVMWQKSSSSSAGSSSPSTRAEDGVGTSGEISDGSTSYTIVGLESETLYSITVRVNNPAGSSDSQPISVSTLGMCTSVYMYMYTCVHECILHCYRSGQLPGRKCRCSSGRGHRGYHCSAAGRGRNHSDFRLVEEEVCCSSVNLQLCVVLVGTYTVCVPYMCLCTHCLVYIVSVRRLSSSLYMYIHVHVRV